MEWQLVATSCVIQTIYTVAKILITTIMIVVMAVLTVIAVAVMLAVVIIDSGINGALQTIFSLVSSR